MKDPADYQWVNTGFSTRSKTADVDGGRVGWKLHAVKASAKETDEQIRHRRAACGLNTHLGWDLDLFASEMRKCFRCLRALGFACVKCRSHGFLPGPGGVYITCADCRGLGIVAEAVALGVQNKGT